MRARSYCASTRMSSNVSRKSMQRKIDLHLTLEYKSDVKYHFQQACRYSIDDVIWFIFKSEKINSKLFTKKVFSKI